MDIFTMLKEDHRKTKKKFKECESKKTTTAKKAKLAIALFKELDIHMALEESTLYPRLKELTKDEDARHNKLRALVNESDEEHHVAKALIAELRQIDPSDETFDAKLKVLQENVEHHIKEEEEDLFPRAKKALKEEVDEISARAQKLKKELESQNKSTRTQSIPQAYHLANNEYQPSL